MQRSANRFSKWHEGKAYHLAPAASSLASATTICDICQQVIATLSIENWWYGLISYAACHCTHILLWNKEKLFPTKWVGVKALVLILVLLPTLIYAVIFVLNSANPSFIFAYLTHFLVAANYISIYPALQASSPSLTLLEELHRSPAGLTETEILVRYPNAKLLEERLHDLESGKFLINTPGGIYLTQWGNILAGFFISFRKCLGLPTGAG